MPFLCDLRRDDQIAISHWAKCGTFEDLVCADCDVFRSFAKTRATGNQAAYIDLLSSRDVGNQRTEASSAVCFLQAALIVSSNTTNAWARSWFIAENAAS